MTKINDGIGPTDKYHIAYLSRELTKAEIAITHGFEYVQDMPIVKKFDLK